MTKLSATRLILLGVLTVFLFFTGCTCPHKYLPMEHPPCPEPVRVPEKIRVCLVLGSGGVRGMAHVGVLTVLEEAGIPIDMIVGCSAGSLVGALYADHPDSSYVYRAVNSMRSETILDINLWTCRFGLSQGKTFDRVMDSYLAAETFDQLQIPMIAVASDLHSGELVPIGTGDLVKAVQASCAIPFVFVPVDLNGRVLVDGGVVNPVPVCLAKDVGAEVIIAVDLRELLPKTFPTNLFEVAARSAEIAFLWQNAVCTKGADIIIRPTLCDVGAFNDKMKQEIFLAGRAAAIAALPQIQEKMTRLSCKEPCSSTRLVKIECYRPE